MTIIISYFQYEYAISRIFLAALVIIQNILIFESGRKQLEGIKKPHLLKRIAVINILFIIIPFVLPSMSSGVYDPIEAQTEGMLVNFYYIFLGLLESMPFFFTYGVLLFIFGKINREQYHSFLLTSGILGLCGWGISIYTYSNIDLISWAFILPASLAYIINLCAFPLLMIHGVKNGDKYLLWAGIAGLVPLIFIFI
jgi:hypothetical protein